MITKTCLNCEKTEEEIPLLDLHYQSGKLFICPQCLPVLIHKSEKLVGKLPGAENFGEAEHHH